MVRRTGPSRTESDRLVLRAVDEDASPFRARVVRQLTPPAAPGGAPRQALAPGPPGCLIPASYLYPRAQSSMTPSTFSRVMMPAPASMLDGAMP